MIRTWAAVGVSLAGNIVGAAFLTDTPFWPRLCGMLTVGAATVVMCALLDGKPIRGL
jgi:hypothetical protein